MFPWPLWEVAKLKEKMYLNLLRIKCPVRAAVISCVTRALARNPKGEWGKPHLPLEHCSLIKFEAGFSLLD